MIWIKPLWIGFFLGALAGEAARPTCPAQVLFPRSTALFSQANPGLDAIVDAYREILQQAVQQGVLSLPQLDAMAAAGRPSEFTVSTSDSTVWAEGLAQLAAAARSQGVWDAFSRRAAGVLDDVRGAAQASTQAAQRASERTRKPLVRGLVKKILHPGRKTKAYIMMMAQFVPGSRDVIVSYSEVNTSDTPASTVLWTSSPDATTVLGSAGTMGGTLQVFLGGKGGVLQPAMLDRAGMENVQIYPELKVILRDESYKLTGGRLDSEAASFVAWSTYDERLLARSLDPAKPSVRKTFAKQTYGSIAAAGGKGLFYVQGFYGRPQILEVSEDLVSRDLPTERALLGREIATHPGRDLLAFADELGISLAHGGKVIGDPYPDSYLMGGLEGRDLPFVLEISPKGKFLAAGLKSGRCVVYELPTLRRVASWKAETDAVRRVSFSHDEELVLTAALTGSVNVWQVDEAGLE